MKVLAAFLFLLLAAAFCLNTYAAETNSIVWHKAADRVDADVHGLSLSNLLEQITSQTGWRVYVEPGTTHRASTKFNNLPPGDALRMLFGDLNFALVPQTNAAPHLYVFTTRMEHATQLVRVSKRAAPRHIPNELLVKLKPGANIDALAKAIGAKVIGRDDKLGIYRLQFADAAATDDALGQLKNNQDVEDVDYNYVYDPPPTPQTLDNAPMGPVSLTLDPSTPNDPCSPVVGLIDTPVQSLGSQLDPFMLKPISVVGDVTAGSTGITHGTAMAQTVLRGISQQKDNTGSNGSKVRILPVNVYGSSETTTTWDVARGVQAAVDNGATVLNMSLGGTTDSAVLDDILRQAMARGIPVFAAAGNQSGTTLTYPAAVPGVTAVTALGAPGQLASYADYGSFVDMALPGSSVVYFGNQAYVVQGTSASTAYATGVAAGVKGINCQPWSQIQSAMQQKFPVPQK
jgi:thermitase